MKYTIDKITTKYRNPLAIRAYKTSEGWFSCEMAVTNTSLAELHRKGTTFIEVEAKNSSGLKVTPGFYMAELESHDYNDHVIHVVVTKYDNVYTKYQVFFDDEELYPDEFIMLKRLGQVYRKIFELGGHMTVHRLDKCFVRSKGKDSTTTNIDIRRHLPKSEVASKSSYDWSTLGDDLFYKIAEPFVPAKKWEIFKSNYDGIDLTNPIVFYTNLKGFCLNYGLKHWWESQVRLIHMNWYASVVVNKDFVAINDEDKRIVRLMTDSVLMCPIASALKLGALWFGFGYNKDGRRGIIRVKALSGDCFEYIEKQILILTWHYSPGRTQRELAEQILAI